MNPTPARRWYRFSLRTMLVLVTLVSLACWVWKRHIEFRDHAEFHQQAINKLIPPEMIFGNGVFHYSHSHDLYQVLGYGEARFLQYHSELVEKYRRAARYPWLPVAPDPPEPESPATQD